jgi:hypothetical protein
MNASRNEICDDIIDWADATTRVRRVWLIGSSANSTKRSDCEIEVGLEVEPVADSEETLVVWMNNGERWRGELQNRLGRSVNLEWFDPDGSTPEVHVALRDASILVYDRAVVT